jgi:hypothetical protein
VLHKRVPPPHIEWETERMAKRAEAMTPWGVVCEVIRTAISGRVNPSVTAKQRRDVGE